MELSKEILESLNESLIKKPLTQNNNRIFYKYTTESFNKHVLEFLGTLSNKCSYHTRKKIFYSSLSYLLKILSNCKNEIKIQNFDILLLTIFNISLKINDIQKRKISITNLKKLYERKNFNIDNTEIKKTEILCLKLLDYDINIITPYDYLFYLFRNNEKLINTPLEFLNKKYLKNIKEFITEKPLDIAIQCIIKSQKIDGNIFNAQLKEINEFIHNDNNIDNISTSSSCGSSNNDNFNFNKKNFNKTLSLNSLCKIQVKNKNLKNNLLKKKTTISLNNSTLLIKTKTTDNNNETNKKTFVQKNIIRLCNNINNFHKVASSNIIINYTKKNDEIKNVQNLSKNTKNQVINKKERIQIFNNNATKVFFRKNRINSDCNRSKIGSLKVYMNQFSTKH